jgi:hypothetical protein
VIIVPEQMGKISPLDADLTMKAPVLLNVLFESMKPYVMAEAFGVSKSDAVIKLTVSVTKQIIRFICVSLFVYECCCGMAGTEGF